MEAGMVARSGIGAGGIPAAGRSGCRCVVRKERCCGGPFLLVLVVCDCVMVSVFGAWVRNCLCWCGG